MRLCLVLLSVFVMMLDAQRPGRPKARLPPVESGSVEGQVVDAVTGEPLKKTEIYLWESGAGEQQYETTSASGGKFIMRDIAPGTYEVSGSKRGYAGTMRRSTTLSLDPGQHLEHIVLRMSPQAVITGRALDDDGEPLPNVMIFLLRYRFAGGKRELQQASEAGTNDLGEYRMFGLSPGTYYLRATPNDISGRRRDYDDGHGYASVYYPGVTDPAGAKAIELEPGTLLRGVDITMVKTHTFHVRGHVVEPAAKLNAHGASVGLVGLGEPRYIMQSSVFLQVDPQGNFDIKSVLPGVYVVEAGNRLDNRRFYGEQTIEVRDSDVENLVVELAPPGELKGRFQVEGRTTADLAEMQIWLENEQNPMRSVSGTPRKDASFTIADVPPGHYRFSLSGLSDSYYLKSVQYGGREILESGLDLTHGPGGSLQVTLSSNGGQIEGVVLNANDQPAPGAIVVLAPDEPRRGQSRLYKTVTTDQYGRFTIRSIAPGGYKMFSWEQAEDWDYQDPDFLKKFETLGEPRTVAEGSRESAQLRLISSESGKAAPH